MKSFVTLFVVAVIVAVVNASDEPLFDTEGKNVIEVPVVCPPGQQVDHTGRCRPVWRNNNILKVRQLITEYQECARLNPVDTKIACEHLIIDFGTGREYAPASRDGKVDIRNILQPFA